jgi:hypothetical protein
MGKMEDILNYEVKFGIGIGDICLGQSASHIVSRVVTYHGFYVIKTLEIKAFYPDVFVYQLFDSVGLYIDIKTSRLFQIYLSGDFKGKYKSKIGIGDIISELKKIEKNLSYDDDQVFLGGNGELIMVADKELMSLEDEEIDNSKIEAMIIRSY